MGYDGKRKDHEQYYRPCMEGAGYTKDRNAFGPCQTPVTEVMKSMIGDERKKSNNERNERNQGTTQANAIDEDRAFHRDHQRFGKLYSINEK